jgi:DNA helicase II / ATP-dependent DNA helicase PcrA
MAITEGQKAAAEAQQWQAARDPATHVRLVAGPGTGKSRTVEKRVCHALEAGAAPENVFVISFTRATCLELRDRIDNFLAGGPYMAPAARINISTMHALALRLLRRANLLTQYPADPRVLDRWEQKNIYDLELAGELRCNGTRAKEIRQAHDTRWQTLDPASINQARVTDAERAGFNAFHSTRTNLYSCVLPGEVIFKCVENLQLGAIQPENLPTIEHLIVDEFQDLNACDQQFIRLLSGRGAVLFVAGDDDQSIYAFRHADPRGIVTFTTTYANAASHALTDCFRCTPAILQPAVSLIEHNPNRLPKNLQALYGNAAPAVQGSLYVWSFASATQEARAVAESCRQLIANGMAGLEDQILILLSQLNPSSIQVDPITQALSNLGVPYMEPSGAELTEDAAIRAVYAVLRLVRDREEDEPDYIAHRTLVTLLSGVGDGTARSLANETVKNNANYRDLFRTAPVPSWIRGRAASAVGRVSAIIHAVDSWSMSDQLATRVADIGLILSQLIFSAPAQPAAALANWLGFAANLPQEMTLSELCEYLGTTSQDQQSVMDRVTARLSETTEPAQPAVKKIRILTMHGAKGLSGKVVFIPSASQDIVPSRRSMQAPGLLIEQRRLFYVSITRAMAACIISHATLYTGAAAQALAQRSSVRLTRSQFLNEMSVTSVNRSSGLSSAEAQAILNDVANL